MRSTKQDYGTLLSCALVPNSQEISKNSKGTYGGLGTCENLLHSNFADPDEISLVQVP
ncbi:MAG: hypothetical protein OHK0023_15580 [Anaerolineae bacterium]